MSFLLQIYHYTTDNSAVVYAHAMEGSRGKIIFAPVWDFFGNEVTTFEDGIGGDFGAALDDNNAYALDLGNDSLLTINALDGTIINRDY